ncbi:hypothetical protein BDZ94DRAFT_1246985 [Collybia nuda]|uniref:Uncharacterized protein n=1 Tax=Collybia nuda TaxID=64659 RepID=A0A9P5YGA5_9AGAR|nr:hypothetical protein BDZ94DRAFT_1246985 [Collybia nuda]
MSPRIMSLQDISRLLLRYTSTSAHTPMWRISGTNRIYNKSEHKILRGTNKDTISDPITSMLYTSVPGWDENLATTSEAFVKADRSGPTASPTGDLLAQTIKYVQSRYSRDTITGFPS